MTRAAEHRMRTALLHYWLVARRGGEKVLEELAEIFPDADIFTHAYAPEKFGGAFRGHRVRETFVSRLPGARKNCQKYLPLMPFALRKLDLSAYDLIVSSESGPAKGVRKRHGAPHVCYCHTPMRYLWDLYDEYYRNAGAGGRLAMRLFRDGLRRYDLASAENVDLFIANSEFVRERIARIYGREALVIHPPVDTEFYGKTETEKKTEKKDYYLLAGQLVFYKNPALALRVCERLGRKLVVAGEGPLEPELRKLAGKNTVFTGRAPDEKLRELYRGARALLFPGAEDFGIVPVEAMAAGTPVVALGKGGALETVVDGLTGVFSSGATEEAFTGAIERFESLSLNPEECRKRASEFSRKRFRTEIRKALEGLLKQKNAG